MIDEIRDAGLARVRHQRLAQGLDGLRLVGLEAAQGNALGAGLAGGEQDFRAADHEGERTRALHEGAPFDAMHDFPPLRPPGDRHRCDHGLRKVNAKPGLESSCRL